MTTIKVAIVEDDAPLRSHMELLINGSPGFACTGCYPSAEAAIAQIPGNPPDVILMDVNLPKASGIDCVKELCARCPNANVLMLTIDGDPETIFRALRAGANGYLIKGTPPAELLEAITMVQAGGSPMSSTVARKVIQFFRSEPAETGTEDLSKRETEILELLAQGLTDKEIATRLGIASDTVHTHVRRIYGKLHVNSRTQAVAQYYGRRWFPWPLKKRRNESLPSRSPGTQNR